MTRPAAAVAAPDEVPDPGPDTEVICAAITAVVNDRRRDLGLTMESLAEAAGVNRQTISRISNGKNYPLWTAAYNLAHGLQWTMVELSAAIERRIREMQAARL